ncbi:pantothenate synthetase [Tahibacter aquaticus]|jgi:pantoate--beta-alanine ligase|uniref:Pantothenate synthetase n=1 Tax=Tahibacter aquaticus TaxID=520092 RepID=A0A4R6YWX1_9GAMM|nr:pantoate--beta-alanine ligase [Tahibacter aquaticus]TDR43295.1 pantothenate synthetase [Tahibacter aquaticus]
MDMLHSAQDLRAVVGRWRTAGLRIGFVPTMGNLHAGHYSLLRTARERCDRVLASVFVNPTQFGPNEDFARYPRTLDADAAGLAEQGCDLLFVPETATLYPFGTEAATRVDVRGVTEMLEGAFRPGHFAGVATVVLRLLNLVQPDVAIFGRKDYQQLLTIRRLAADLCLPVDIVAAPTLREANGLAMSSRNQYLSPVEREQAAAIHHTLQAMRESVIRGETLAQIEANAVAALDASGFRTDYAALRCADDLALPPAGQRDGLVALIAARLGNTRLIDNLAIDNGVG